jgi:hypothetical protein
MVGSPEVTGSFRSRKYCLVFGYHLPKSVAIILCWKLLDVRRVFEMILVSLKNGGML